MAERTPWIVVCSLLAGCVLILQLVWFTPVVAGEVTLRIIVHPSVPVGSMTRADLEAIFRRQERVWRGDGVVIPFNQEWTSPLRRSFDQAVLGLDVAGSQKYWMDTLVRGGPQPPRSVESPLLVSRLVARLPGAIGYVDEYVDTKGTRVVARIRGGMVVAP